MVKRLLHRCIASLLVLAMAAAVAAPGAAAPTLSVPEQQLAGAAMPASHAVVGERDKHPHHRADAAHTHCTICLGFPVPAGLAEAVPMQRASFPVGRHSFAAGLPPDLEPHPPRSLLHRI